MRTSSKTIQSPIIFLGIGSYNMTQTKKSVKGLFWTLKEGKVFFMDMRTPTIKESSFDTYQDFVQYCAKKFPECKITT